MLTEVPRFIRARGELGREEAEAQDRLDAVRVEIGLAEGQLARLRASLREILGSAQAAVPPDPD